MQCYPPCKEMSYRHSFCEIYIWLEFKVRPQDYKTFFMPNSTEHEISTAHKNLKYEYRQMKKFLALSLSDVVFIMLINITMQDKFRLSWVEHGNFFITLKPGYTQCYRLEVGNSEYFFSVSTKRNVSGAQKSHLINMILLSTNLNLIPINGYFGKQWRIR